MFYHVAQHTSDGATSAEKQSANAGAKPRERCCTELRRTVPNLRGDSAQSSSQRKPRGILRAASFRNGWLHTQTTLPEKPNGGNEKVPKDP